MVDSYLGSYLDSSFCVAITSNIKRKHSVHNREQLKMRLAAPAIVVGNNIEDRGHVFVGGFFFGYTFYCPLSQL